MSNTSRRLLLRIQAILGVYWGSIGAIEVLIGIYGDNGKKMETTVMGYSRFTHTKLRELLGFRSLFGSDRGSCGRFGSKIKGSR